MLIYYILDSRNKIILKKGGKIGNGVKVHDDGYSN